MKTRISVIIFLLALLASQFAYAEHSFSISEIDITPTTATYVGTATAAEALNLIMTVQACDAQNTQAFTGNSHTFTQVGETFTFVVTYPQGTFRASGPLLVSVSDTPSQSYCNNGSQGAVQFFSVAKSIPTLGTTGFTTLILLMMLMSVAVLGRGRSWS